MEWNKLRRYLKPETVEETDKKGFMSSIYTAKDHEDNELIIHEIKPVKEQEKHNIHKKIKYVSKVLTSFPEIPNAEVIHTGERNNKWIIIQKKLPGKTSGKRDVIGKEIIDIYDKPEVKPQTLRILARLHTIRFPKHGIIKDRNGFVDGKYASWKEYLMTQSHEWMNNLKESSQKIRNLFEKYELEKNVNKLFLKDKLFICRHPRLIHGDMLNPGNILHEEGRVTGIIDFEWAIAGDPAWEFAYKRPEDLNVYYREAEKLGTKIPKKLFEEKIKIYNLLWLLWGANVHIDGNKKVQRILLEQFINRLRRYNHSQ